MTAGRAWIAVPLPPPETWQLLRDAHDLPEGYAIIGSVTVGVADTPALPARRLRQLAVELCERCPYRPREET